MTPNISSMNRVGHRKRVIIPQNTTPISTATPKNKLSDKIRTILNKNGYTIVHEIDKPGKAASYHIGAKDLGQRVEE